MTRERLPNRHPGVTVEVAWFSASGGGPFDGRTPDRKLIVTYGLNEHGQIREAFCASFRAAGDIVALANDACICFSRCLQHGDGLEELANGMSENRREGETSGPPASLLGAIARKAVEVQKQINNLRGRKGADST